MIQRRMQEHWQKKKSCMQKLHTLNIESGFSFSPAALAFLILSLYLILILKCKHWRKKRTEKNTPLNMFLNKALCHIAAFRLSCKSWAKNSSLAALLSLASALSQPTSAAAKSSITESAIILVILLFVVCDDILPFQKNKSKWKRKKEVRSSAVKYWPGSFWIPAGQEMFFSPNKYDVQCLFTQTCRD